MPKKEKSSAPVTHSFLLHCLLPAAVSSEGSIIFTGWESL